MPTRRKPKSGSASLSKSGIRSIPFLRIESIHECCSRRIEERLTKLEARLKKVGKVADRDKVAVQVGRILGQNPRAAGMYKVRIKVDANRGTGLSVSFKTKPESAEWTTATEGVYALRTSPDVSGWTAEDLWATYMQLTDAESAFRTGLAPEGGPRPGPHPGGLPRVRAVEDAGQWQK